MGTRQKTILVMDTDSQILKGLVLLLGVIVKSGVWAIESSGDLVVILYFDSIFKFDPFDHLRQVIEAA